MQTAEAVSKMLGQQTLESSSISQSISLNNFSGNQSTSLMSRALLTPDEIKNLHYKTIIFPNIGYPIFRDTVIYKKFSCYSKGEVDRKINPLKDLSDTYFTVEQIKIKQKNNNEETTLYNEMNDLDKNRLQPAINIINGILKSKIKTFEFKNENGRTYVSFIIDGNLNPKEIAMIKGKVNKEKFHLNINLQEMESIIELHLKGLFETNLYQTKGVTNNV